MAEKSAIKEYLCLANISIKGKIEYEKDAFYTAEEYRRSPKHLKHKFAKLEDIRPEAIDGTVEELRALTQRLTIKINSLQAYILELEEKLGVQHREEKVEAKGAAITSKTGGQKEPEK